MSDDLRRAMEREVDRRYPGMLLMSGRRRFIEGAEWMAGEVIRMAEARGKGCDEVRRHDAANSLYALAHDMKATRSLEGTLKKP